MVLALIATIFLPISWLSGVFGMNFMVPEHGGQKYSPGLGLLNVRWGPAVYWAMCVIFVGLSVGYFRYKGYHALLFRRQLYKRSGAPRQPRGRHKSGRRTFKIN